MPITALAASGVPEGIGIFIPAIYDIVWSLIPFALIVGFFVFYAVPRFSKILDERRNVIEGGIERAENAQAEAQKQLDEYNRLLAEARQEAAGIRENARQEGAVILADLKEQANAEAARITATAHAQIEAERQAALQSLRGEVGSLAIQLAGGVIGESLTDDRRSTALVDRFLADLEASEAAKAGKAGI
jgi:F-type H+-transporting ATPase subunit b